jgi:lysyl-tRNA synthetase class II
MNSGPDISKSFGRPRIPSHTPTSSIPPSRSPHISRGMAWKARSLPGQKLTGEIVALAGRIHNIRHSGQKLRFYDLHAEGKKVQIMATLQDDKDPENFISTHENFRRGDIVGVVGTPSRTKKGELSISPSKTILLSPNLHQLPSGHFGLKDQETRYRKRYLDLIISEDTRRIFITRSKIVNYIRRYLDSLWFPRSRNADDEHGGWRSNRQAVYHSPQRSWDRPLPSDCPRTLLEGARGRWP